jgi:hypothetical protein
LVFSFIFPALAFADSSQTRGEEQPIGVLQAVAPLQQSTAPEFPNAELDEIIVVYDNAGAASSRTLEAGGLRAQAVDDFKPLETTGFAVIEEVVPATQDSGTIVLAQVPAGTTVAEAVASVSSLPGVAYAQPNFRYFLLDTVDDAALESSPSDFGTLATTTNDPNNTNASTSPNQYYLYNTHTDVAWDTAKAQGQVTIAV